MLHTHCEISLSISYLCVLNCKNNLDMLRLQIHTDTMCARVCLQSHLAAQRHVCGVHRQTDGHSTRPIKRLADSAAVTASLTDSLHLDICHPPRYTFGFKLSESLSETIILLNGCVDI